MTSANSHVPSRVSTVPPGEGEQFTIIGGSVRILIDGETSGGRCCMFDCPVSPGDGPPLHRHENEDELFYVLEGRFKFSLDGHVVIGEPGTFANAPRGSVHAFKNVGTTMGRLLVTCTPAGLEIPFRAVRIPELGSGQQPLSPEQVVAEFLKAGIEFVGPPLEP